MDIDPNSWRVSFPLLKLLSVLEVRACLSNSSLGFLNDLKDCNEEDTTTNIRSVRRDNDTVPTDIFRAVPQVQQVPTMAATPCTRQLKGRKKYDNWWDGLRYFQVSMLPFGQVNSFTFLRIKTLVAFSYGICLH